jgi:FAD dependent oxidoreductase TIGR03364
MQHKQDLIVVGAGILGAFHAFHALRAGKRVTLFEKDQYPVSATVRNFGQVVPSGMTGRWLEYGRRSMEWYRSIQQELDISVRDNGTVYIASDPDEQQLIHELKQIMDTRQYAAELLNTEQCLEKWPVLKKDYCKEALYFPQELSVAPESMIYRLLAYMQQKFPSFTYRPHTAILDCHPSGDGAGVVTAGGEKWQAAKVVICNGGEYKLLFPELFRASGIVLSKLQMMRTKPLPEVNLKGNILTGLTIRRYESFEECPSFHGLSVPGHLKELKKWGIHILFKQADDGSIIIGDSHEYADVLHSDDLGFAVKQHINGLMLDEARRIVTFDPGKLDTVWTGVYPQHKERDIVEEDLEGCIHIRTAIGGKGMTSGAGYAEESIRKLFGES